MINTHTKSYSAIFVNIHTVKQKGCFVLLHSKGIAQNNLQFLLGDVAFVVLVKELQTQTHTSHTCVQE